MSEPSTVVSLPVGALVPDPNNVRRRVGDVTELARSIEAVGVIEPCLVTPIDGDPDHYRLVAGHRRHAACLKAGIAEVPCLVRELSEAEVVETQLVENLQRSALTVLEEAGAYLRLCGLGYSARKLARRVGRSERHVRERLALLELPESAQAAIDGGDLSLADAKVLVVVKDHPDVIDQVVADRPRDVAWAVKQRLRRRAVEERRAVLAGEQEAAGVRVVADEGHRPSGYVALGDLGIDPKAHAAEPCHAVVIADHYDGPQAVAVCTERRRHTKAGASPVKRTEQDDDRAAERERAKLRRQAAAARGEFLAGRLGRRLPKGPAVDFALRTLVERANANEAGRAAEALGVDAAPGPFGPSHLAALRDRAAQGDAEAVRVAVAVAAAMAEATVAAASTTLSPTGAGYLSFLVGLGYDLADVERHALDELHRHGTGGTEAAGTEEDAA